MKTNPIQRQTAFTRVELTVVIVIFAFLMVMLVPALHRAKQKADRITCISNFEDIGLGTRLWAGEHGDLPPASTAITNGGWHDLLSNSNAGAYCWRNFAAMSNELGGWPGVLVCPSDERRHVESFADFKDNTHLSYFVGVEAKDVNHDSIIGGDRNLGPGTVPDPEYGYSPTNGKGNDVIITGPVSWSLKMHSHGSTVGAGNILLSDGSVQQASSEAMITNWLPGAIVAVQTNAVGTNRAGTRLIFP